MAKKQVSVAAFCNPLLDMIAHVDHEFIERLNVHPGTMNLVDFSKLEDIRKGLDRYEILPGGSGAVKVAIPVMRAALRGPRP